MKTINELINFRLLAILFTALVIASCSSDDDGGVEAPGEENEVEVKNYRFQEKFHLAQILSIH